MGNALVPELLVRDWSVTRAFYVDVLGFEVAYERPEEGFSYLKLGAAELMIDQLGVGRDFGDAPLELPFGRGVNFQIEVTDVRALIDRISAHKVPLVLTPEEKWYRVGNAELGNRQFIVADPDGYLLRFFEDIGRR